MEHPQDVGPIYVRENGKLRRPWAGHQMSHSPKIHLEINKICCFQKTDDFFHTLTLREICVHFVAANIHFADSLEGFPSLIGKEIFDFCIKLDQFQTPTEEAGNILSLFCDAYEEDFLVEMSCFRLRHINLEEVLPYILHFKHLQKLDLFGCSLGDDHDILIWISNLTRFE